MKKELVFLLEEPSAKEMLKSLLPRILNPEIEFRLIAFEGKQDLQKQLVHKIRAFQNPCARFIILQDQDSHVCIRIKEKLLDLCRQTLKHKNCLVRIACKELEAFYLADLSAVEKALNISGLAKKQLTRKFKMPDNLESPSHELEILTKHAYSKVAGSREIGKQLNLGNTRSPSFQNLISAIHRMQNELLNLEC